MPRTVTIDVTNEDIDESKEMCMATQKWGYDCAIARAASRVIGTKCQVSFFFIYYAQKGLNLKSTHMPIEGSLYVQAFDNWALGNTDTRPDPISFEVTLDNDDV